MTEDALFREPPDLCREPSTEQSMRPLSPSQARMYELLHENEPMLLRDLALLGGWSRSVASWLLGGLRRRELADCSNPGNGAHWSTPERIERYRADTDKRLAERRHQEALRRKEKAEQEIPDEWYERSVRIVDAAQCERPNGISSVWQLGAK